MNKSILIFFFALFFNVFIVAAQTNSTPAVAGQTSIEKDAQWEYLIVSVTKFQLDVGEKEEPAQRKWLDRRTGSVGFFQEAEVQREFDRLGKLGWELCGVLPSSDNNGNFVYGTSKLIFKRRLDLERSQREIELLQADEKEKAQNLKKPTEFIDLDAAELIAQREEIESRAETRLSQSLKTIKQIPLKIASIKATTQNKGEVVTQAEVIIDGSQILLKNGNKYRASEARDYLRKVATGIFDSIGLKLTGSNQEPFHPYVAFNPATNIRIVISVVVNSNETTRTVAQGSISGNWAEIALLKKQF